MQLHTGRYMGLQLLPDGNGQVFGRTKLVLHERHIYIKVFMVQLFSYVLINNAAQRFHIAHKPGIGIGTAFYGYIQFVIVAMPVLIGTFSKNLFILLLAPPGVVLFMGGIKVFNTSQIHHCCRENLPQR